MENKIIEFLIEAKKGTYANDTSNSKVSSSRQGSKDYEYKKGNMTYHDTYFGGIRFIGEEVIYIDSNEPIWGMNYYGVTLDETLSEEAMDKALRPALMQVGEDKNIIPVRGPQHFENDGYTYSFKVEGNIENFSGIEEIYQGEKIIYRLYCTGGLIK